MILTLKGKSFMPQINIQIHDHDLLVEMMDNSSSKALIKRLKQSDIVLEMKEFANMEKFGVLDEKYPQNDEWVTTLCRDVILSEGYLLVIYYAPNTWNFTKIGKVINVSDEEFKRILGKGNVHARIHLVKE